MFSEFNAILDKYDNFINELKPIRFIDEHILNAPPQKFDEDEIPFLSEEILLPELEGLDELSESDDSFLESFSEGAFDNLNLDDSQFYDGDEVDEVYEDLKKILKEDEILNIIAKLELQTTEFFREFTINICKIYLEGDFLDFEEEKYNLLIDRLDNYPVSIDTGSQDNFQLILSDNVWDFVNGLKEALQSLKNFSIHISKSFSLSKNDNFFYIDTKFNLSEDYYRKYTNKKFASYLDLQNLILRLSTFDFFLNDEFKEIKYLVYLENELKKFENETSNIYICALAKLNFLKNKWFLRKQEQVIQKNKQINEVEYRIDNEIFTLEVKRNELYNNWLEKIYYHYDINKDREEIHTKIVNPILHKKLHKLTFYELHSLIKYYKDVKFNLNKLKEILDYILEFESKEYHRYNDFSSYDKYCFQIIKNYTINNYFSAYSENINDLKEYINEYKFCKYSLNNIVDNYFLDYKFLDKALDYIIYRLNKNSKSESDYKEIEEFCDIINTDFKNVIDKYYDKKEWAKINSNFIFIMPKNESILKVNNDDSAENQIISKIFVATSFILPFDYNESDKNYSSVRQKFREVKSLAGVLLNLKKDLNKIEELNKEFDRKDLKSIEIISLFTAIITFVLSSIPAFKFINSISEALLFMMSLAGALGIFILLIFWHTRKITSDKSKYSTTIPIIVIILLLTISCLTMIFINKRTDIDNLIMRDIDNKKERIELDSIKKTILKLDMEPLNNK